MADENNEDDSWLYGSNSENTDNQDTKLSQNDEKTVSETAENDDIVEIAQNTESKTEEQANANNDTANITSDTLNGSSDVNGENYNGDGDGDGDDEEKSKSDSDNDDSDDDIVVTIRDIQPASSFNIKQRGTLAASGAAAQEKPKTNLGKFSIEEFESVGTIAGQSAIEYNIEAIEDKPWRKPGADITDYFNYGFSEETWRAYCERQKKMRHESGAGLTGLNPQQSTNNINNNVANRTLTALTSTDNSKYSAPGSTNSHTHGGPANFQNRSGFGAPPEQPSKENVIQVMTAERREYSRPKGKFDVSLSMPPPPFNMANEPFYPEDNYSYGYEPTQEQQWNNDANVGWMPSGIKELTPGPQNNMMNIPPPALNMNMNMPPPNAMIPPMLNVPPQMVPPPHNMNMNMPMPNPMMPPPVIPTMPNRDRMSEDHRNNQNDYREHDDKRSASSTSAWRSRDKERDYRERERDEESRRERDRYRSDRDRDRGSSRRDRSRSRERSERRRRSKSRESSRKSRDKKKSHKKDKDDSD